MKIKTILSILTCVIIGLFLFSNPYLIKAQSSNSFNKISLAPIANFNYQSQSIYSGYANPPRGDVTLGGIPFFIPDNNNALNTFVGNNYIQRISTNIPYPLKVHMLMNSGNTMLTTNGKIIGSITLDFSDGDSVATNIVVGQNIREWRPISNTVNTVSDQRVKMVYDENAGGRIIDMYSLDVPENFQNKTLTGVRINDTYNTNENTALLWSGLTVESLNAPLPPPPPNQEEVYFFDDFNGSSIDTSKWDTSNLTSGKRWCTDSTANELGGIGSWIDVTNQLCKGYKQSTPFGSATVANGELKLLSNQGMAFPLLLSGPPEFSPFPESGNFTFEMRMKYDSLQSWGDGATINSNTITPTGNEPPMGPFDLFGVWAGSTWGRTYLLGQYTNMLNKLDFHSYRLEFKGGLYSLYIDDILISNSEANGKRPKTIALGNPVFTYWGSNDWTDFTVDYIKVTKPKTSTPELCSVTTSPNTQNLSVGGTAQISASVTSGLGYATVSKMEFGTYNTAFATVNSEEDLISPYETTVTGVAPGDTAVWATATLSDGRTCQSNGDNDTEVNVTSAPIPTPFLDLPWNYDCKQSTDVEINKTCKDKNKELDFESAALDINYYFDHTYPLLWIGSSNEPATASGQITAFDGKSYDEKDRGYSTHDGYDYGKKAKVDYGDPVLAAATGSARYIDSCSSCGNMVVIRHPNGYQTRYMHLQKDGLIDSTPNKEVSVSARQIIGKVGNTGNCKPKANDADTSCAHIHFMVVKEKENQSNINDNMPMGVNDPFGWEPFTEESKRDPDPWENYTFDYLGKSQTGCKSYYLWKDKLPNLKETANSDGGTYTVGKVSLEVLPDTLPDNTSLEMHYTPSANATDSIWSIGPVISITAQKVGGDFITVLTKPVNLIWYPFRDSDLARYKVGSFYLYSSKDGSDWTKETPVDPLIPGNITAAASHFTYFAIMGERKDMTSPVTGVGLQGLQGQNNWFRSDVNVALTATDSADVDPAGVDYTLYKIEEEDWKTYVAPLNFTNEGHYKVSYYSSDNDGNIEGIKTVEFDIDKIAPEAQISYDLSNFDSKVSGKNNLGSASATLDKTKPLQPKFTITDQAGNTLILNTGKIKIGKQVALTIKSLQYNNNPIISLDPNVLFTLALTGTNNNLKQLDQYYTLKDDKKIFTSYSSSNNTTKIYTKTPGGATYTSEEKPGIILLNLETEGGKLKYSN